MIRPAPVLGYSWVAGGRICPLTSIRIAILKHGRGIIEGEVTERHRGGVADVDERRLIGERTRAHLILPCWVLKPHHLDRFRATVTLKVAANLS